MSKDVDLKPKEVAHLTTMRLAASPKGSASSSNRAPSSTSVVAEVGRRVKDNGPNELLVAHVVEPDALLVEHHELLAGLVDRQRGGVAKLVARVLQVQPRAVLLRARVEEADLKM